MQDLGFLDTPIEVASKSPRYEMIAARLRDTGLRPYRSAYDAHPSDPILLDVAALTAGDIHKLERLLADDPGRTKIVLAERGHPAAAGDIVLFDAGDLPSLAGRLAAHRRLWLQNDEARLRQETLARLSSRRPLRTTAEQAQTVPRILYVGDGSPYFLGLKSALQAEGAEVVGALTRRTAMDYLMRERFGAILIDLTRNSDEAIGLLENLDGLDEANAPVRIACLGPNENQNEATRRAIGQADEIIDTANRLDMAARQIILSANRTATHLAATARGITDPEIIDLQTGLHTARFLDHHLSQQMIICEQRQTPLSVLSLRLRSSQDEDRSARHAMAQLATHIIPTLRRTDCAARIDWTIAAISLRGVNYGGAVRIAERIYARLGGDDIGAAGSPLPFGGSLSWRVAERRRYHHSASDLLSAALEMPYKRIQRRVA